MREQSIELPNSHAPWRNYNDTGGALYKPISKQFTVLYELYSYAHNQTKALDQVMEKAIDLNPDKTLLYTTTPGQEYIIQALKNVNFEKVAACSNPNTSNNITLWARTPAVASTKKGSSTVPRVPAPFTSG